MTRPFRKTTQGLAPGTRPEENGQYGIYPAYPLGAGQIELGFAAVARRLAGADRIIMDGMSGVLWEDFRRQLTAALAAFGREHEWVNIDEALLPEAEIEQLLARSLGGSDPLFGTRCPRPLADIFQPEKLAALARRFHSQPRAILYGTGAALAGAPGLLVYLDVPKNEIQFRSRASSAGNLGRRAPSDPKSIYKRLYFADWPMLRAHQAELLPRLDLIIDTQRPGEPAAMSGADFRSGLARVARSWARVRPWFEPGPWGGQWMKRRFPGLPAEAPNLAWSFELISPENGLVFESGGRLLEASFDFLMAAERDAVLGDFAPRFGREFPIRFDYLDTFEGGNLSLQCHPRPEYAWRHFGERFTQDETYYLTDCGPDARVFLGFRAGINPGAFAGALREADQKSAALDLDHYVQSHPSRKHGLYLIPNGAIHCSGRDNLVLEISATPYIFTFKMYDWQRLDLDGRPRPLNIERALENLRFEYQGPRVVKELISRPIAIGSGPGWVLTHLPTHAGHFYDVHRFDFSTAVEGRTLGSPHVLNVVEGPSVLLETPSQPPRRFAFGETFIIPAATETYRLASETGQPVKVIKAFLKPEAKVLPEYLA